MSKHALKTLFVVRDPGPKSTISDIFFEVSPNELAAYTVGTTLSLYESENHTLYPPGCQDDAWQDAQERLRKRDAGLSA